MADLGLVFKCPNCGVTTSPNKTECEVCKTPLPPAAAVTRYFHGAHENPIKWMWIGMAITLGMFLTCWILELHPVTLALALFYGPLIASYLADDNAVSRAALGGLLALGVLVGLGIWQEWHATRVILTALVGGELPTDTGYYDSRGTGVAILVAFGIPILVVAVMPVCLIGASIGEHLASRRRRREHLVTQPLAPVPPPPPRKMTDAEIAKVDL